MLLFSNITFTTSTTNAPVLQFNSPLRQQTLPFPRFVHHFSNKYSHFPVLLTTSTTNTPILPFNSSLGNHTARSRAFSKALPTKNSNIEENERLSEKFKVFPEIFSQNHRIKDPILEKSQKIAVFRDFFCFFS